MTEKEIIKADFKAYFNQELKPFESVTAFFDNEKEYFNYLKKSLYFTKSVIKPLENKGMTISDSIVDVASGDGQMSFALALLGYKNITLFDLDQERLDKGVSLIGLFCNETKAKRISDTATNLNITFDVLISYQTIEHLSDEGNYSIAKKHCQIEFLQNIDKHITKLCFFNAPNRSFPIDGHDTGKPFFHFLPMGVKKYLINHDIVKCSWAGICRPVSIRFLNKYLPSFELKSNYYTYDNMKEYLANRPSFDYMGNRIYSIDVNKLSKKKAIINTVANTLGKNAQKILPVLSVIYKKKTK